MTLHDSIKYYESLGIPREEFIKTGIYARGELAKESRMLGKALYLEIGLPLLRKIKKFVTGIKYRRRMHEDDKC